MVIVCRKRRRRQTSAFFSYTYMNFSYISARIPARTKKCICIFRKCICIFGNFDRYFRKCICNFGKSDRIYKEKRILKVQNLKKSPAALFVTLFSHIIWCWKNRREAAKIVGVKKCISVGNQKNHTVLHQWTDSRSK